MQTLSFPGLKRLPLPKLFTYNVRIKKSDPHSDPEVVDTGLRSKRGLYPDPEQNRREEKETEEDDEPKQTSENKIRQRQPRNQISSDAKSTECPECGKVFSHKRDMVRHYRSVHEGIKYPCNQCDYQATQQSHLQTHIAAKHSDNILQCEFCDYQTKWRNKYYAHKKSFH